MPAVSNHRAPASHDTLALARSRLLFVNHLVGTSVPFAEWCDARSRSGSTPAPSTARRRPLSVSPALLRVSSLCGELRHGYCSVAPHGARDSHLVTTLRAVWSAARPSIDPAISRQRAGRAPRHLVVVPLYGLRHDTQASLFRRSRVSQLGEGRLKRYLNNHAGAAWQHAFEIGAQAPLRYQLERDPLPDVDEFEVVIEQPDFCSLRWDRLLAAELGWSRSRIAKAWRSEILRPEGSIRARDCVRNGQRIRIRLAEGG